MYSVTSTNEYHFFTTLGSVNRPLAVYWWVLIVVRSAVPALLAITTGALVAALTTGAATTPPLLAFGAVFTLGQMLGPVHTQVGANLGERFAENLHHRLFVATTTPAGIGHLESPELTADLAVARDFDLGISGPPLALSMGFIASGLVQFGAGIFSTAVLFAYRWWTPLVVGVAWFSTQFTLRRGTRWDRGTDEVRFAQRKADYTYRLAVESAPAKEIRLFGLGVWIGARFLRARQSLVERRWSEARLRSGSVLVTTAILVVGNGLFFTVLASDAGDGRISTDELITFAVAAIGASGLAFGGLSWALPLAADGVATVPRLERVAGELGALPSGSLDATASPSGHLHLVDVSFSYPNGQRVFEHFDLEIPAGTSLAIVGENGAGKTTLAKLLCRLYDPTHGVLELDGVDAREFDIRTWRSGIAAVFQDFIRYELSLRENIGPLGASDDLIRESLRIAGFGRDLPLDTPLASGYDGGTDLSGGQWQRIALARAVCAVRSGAHLVLLDEPTAQLDVRGESEIFQRVLDVTSECTTVLISHRFSTVRGVDRICVVEDGRPIELGSHTELMSKPSRYRTMFELQASRFTDA